ncbi:hypothetical protein GPROT1_00518 [Gammaproteobacteria bacterium]|jgi:lysophospholipase L1-like esterase|nr:hypothetical protein GPROT1_00518 [Gammaproteobacteria bacterium]
MIRNLLLLAASVLLACLAMEGALRLLYEPPPTWEEPQTRHLESPLLGWVLPPSSRSYTIDAPVHVNSIGLRDAEVEIPKPDGIRRVLCLGDSFTFALGVRFEDLYVERLERRLREAGGGGIEVLNAGVAGYNTRQELITLLTLGASLEPDLVVVGFYWNDLVGNDEPLPDLANTPRIASGERLESEAPKSSWIPRPIRDALRQSVLLYRAVTSAKLLAARFDPPADAYSVVQSALLSGDAATLEPYWEATSRRLLEIAAAAKQRGIPAILMVFPSENEVRHDFPALVFGAKLEAIWAQTGFPFIDLTAAYRESLRRGENPFLPYDLHPNALGMRIAADALFETIVAERYLGFGPSTAAGPDSK